MRKSLALAAAAVVVSSTALAAPFGEPKDVAYAAQLWKVLENTGLVGANAIQSHAYTGAHPHGAVLTTAEARIRVGSDAGTAIVKNNYGGDGVSTEAVSNNPGKYLAAVTVMFKRPGYDADNQDWFWVKYLPDGSLDKNPKGMQLAGQIAKGNTKGGCIACHSAAPGGDMLFTRN